MKLFVVSDNTTGLSALSKTLTELGHSVKTFTDGALALKHLEVEQPEEIVVEGSARFDVAAFVKAVKTNGVAPSVYALVIAGSEAREITAAFNAGSDDVLRKPYTRDELRLRVIGAIRINERVERLVAQAIDRRNPNPLAEAAAWQELDALSAHELSDMSGLSLIASNDLPSVMPCSKAASITLSLPDREIDIPISLQADAHSLNTFAEKILGGPVEDKSFVDQLLLEVANTVAGAFKRKALAAGFELVTGLPSEARLSLLPRLCEGAADKRSFMVEDAEHGVKLRADVLIRRRGNQMVTVGELREGMVLAREVRNGGGVLMLAAGLRLTQSAIKSVLTALGPDYRVQVSSAVI